MKYRVQYPNWMPKDPLPVKEAVKRNLLDDYGGVVECLERNFDTLATAFADLLETLLVSGTVPPEFVAKYCGFKAEVVEEPQP